MEDLIRKCCDCGAEKPLWDFVSKARKKNNRCIVCHKSQISSAKKIYYEKHKVNWVVWGEGHKDKRNARLRERRQTDTQFRIMGTLRARVHDVLKQRKGMKSSAYIGLDTDKLKAWFDYQLSKKPEFTWDNFGDVWIIDHVIPIDAFDLEIPKHRFFALNYTNLQPLGKLENNIKWNKIVIKQIFQHITLVKQFFELNLEGYQSTCENVWWMGEEPVHGKNLEDDTDDTILNRLKSTIRSHVPIVFDLQDMEQVQRLDKDSLAQSMSELKI